MVELNLALCPELTKTRHVPRAPLPDRGVTPAGVMSPASRRRALPLPHRSYELMRQTKAILSYSAFLIRRVLAGCCQSLLGIAPSRHYLCNPCVGAWTPAPRCPSGAHTRFYPENFGLALGVTGLAHQSTPAMQLPQGMHFGAAVISSCSGSHAC